MEKTKQFWLFLTPINGGAAVGGSGPFSDHAVAERALQGALSTGKFAKGEIRETVPNTDGEACSALCPHGFLRSKRDCPCCFPNVGR